MTTLVALGIVVFALTACATVAWFDQNERAHRGRHHDTCVCRLCRARSAR